MQVAKAMAEKARMAAEKVLDWSQRFPTKVAGWAARRAAWGAAAAAKEEAQFAEEAGLPLPFLALPPDSR